MQELTEQLNSTPLPQPILALKPPYQYIGWSYVTESMVTIRSPCCGYNLAWCVELKGAHFWSCSHKIESVSIRKCPYDHWLTNKAYLSAITATSIFRSFTYKMAAKTGWHRYGTKLRHCHLMYTLRHSNNAHTRTYMLHNCTQKKKNIYLSSSRCSCSEQGKLDSTWNFILMPAC